MKTLLITEEQLRKINESLGVPDNIVETSEKVYDGIVKNLNTNKEELIEQKEFSFTINDNFRISGYTFSDLMIKFVIKHDYLTKKFNMTDTAYTNGEPNIDVDNMDMVDLGYSIDNSFILITMEIQNWRLLYRKTILKYFKENRNFIIGKLAHELKHSYDKYMHPNIKIGKSADYQAKIANYTNIPPLNEFIHAMYYTHDFETSVRCSEVYTLLKQNKINRENFKDFMNKNGTVLYLKKLKTLDFDNVYNEILTKYMKSVDSFIKFYGNGLDVSNFNNYKKVDMLLLTVYFFIYEIKNDYKNNYLDGTIELTPENKKYIKNNFDKDKYKSFLKYYYDNQRSINRKADETLKKLYNLYGLLKEGKEEKIDYKKIFPITKYNLIY